jgi:hypothetical protein
MPFPACVTCLAADGNDAIFSTRASADEFETIVPIFTKSLDRPCLSRGRNLADIAHWSGRPTLEERDEKVVTRNCLGYRCLDLFGRKRPGNDK